MMNFTEKIINGKEIAENLNQETKLLISKIKDQCNLVPKLALVLVGDDPASQIYAKNKKAKAFELGIISENFFLSEKTTQDELSLFIENLNHDSSVNGILLQMPLPKHLNSFEIICKIDPKKDVDGFHPENVGMLNMGYAKNCFVPCTPLGCMHLIQTVRQNLSGLKALVIGRSNIVGWPLSRLLLDQNSIVTVAHSHAKNLKELCLEAEIIIAATGKCNLITSDMVNEKHIIIDVGINRIIDENQEKKLVGDVDFENVLPKVLKITKVPGGVGPMTIAFLMKNVLKAFCLQNNLEKEFF